MSTLEKVMIPETRNFPICSLPQLEDMTSAWEDDPEEKALMKAKLKMLVPKNSADWLSFLFEEQLLAKNFSLQGSNNILNNLCVRTEVVQTVWRRTLRSDPKRKFWPLEEQNAEEAKILIIRPYVYNNNSND
ncbi:hypothetical protein DMENIID0001_066920 [Sergentomyia squamirostris]